MSSRVLSLRKVESGRPGKVYYPLQLGREEGRSKPGPNQVLVQLRAAALNHRDLFQRRHLYPGIAFDRAILSDGSGVIRAVGDDVSSFRVGDEVIFSPVRGWIADPVGPEPGDDSWGVTGGSLNNDFGTARDYMVVDAVDIEPKPSHLSAVEAAALPLAGVTAWRAVVTKAKCEEGQNVLITGIGGGVALHALQFVVSLKAKAFVTSGDDDKISRARKLGAEAGVSYRLPNWDSQLRALLPSSRPYLDAIIDGAGGDIIRRALTLLKPGGVVVQYGMTLAPSMNWSILAVLSNLELKGSCLGSRREFADMVAFVNKHKLRPVVYRTVRGLDNLKAINGLFDEMSMGTQFGKLVIEIDGDALQAEATPRL
ncbi:hypothetical protein XA68_17145 [Ophiocordyceps unilateralis]|uniref:Enoyl reductase (ER) domain-containing protein n=1 Tax=Ophiocordyceps unilateralis TaxID=268505 RepID=A0A2A9P3X6_OPHUN|nr:hypothetical protein XA68_17145 [Ophiocordyceps unilateralis]